MTSLFDCTGSAIRGPRISVAISVFICSTRAYQPALSSSAGTGAWAGLATASSACADGGEHKMKRVLGPWNLIVLGIGAIIGAGLFSLTGVAAADNAGPAIVLSFMLAALGCALAGMCYSEMASMIPISGSAYTYA